MSGGGISSLPVCEVEIYRLDAADIHRGSHTFLLGLAVQTLLSLLTLLFLESLAYFWHQIFIECVVIKHFAKTIKSLFSAFLCQIKKIKKTL
jgi:hypothetical protein